VSSTPLETKDHADHAGLSQLLVLLKLLMLLPERVLTPSLNKNLLIALPHMVTLVATVDGWTLPSNTSLPRVSQADLLIPMLEKIKHARDKTELTESPNSLTLLKETVVHWKLLLPQDPSPSLLMLPTGNSTPAEFSATALPHLTTVSFSSELPPPTGRSETLGDPPGENLVTLDLPREILVVSVMLLHTPQLEKNIIHSLLNQYEVTP